MGAVTSPRIFCCVFLFLSLQLKNSESGVPTLLRRLAREVYPEIESDNYGSLREGEVCVLGDVVYTSGEVVPAEQPCLRCKCQPPGVHCETIKCVKKTGCKTVHHPNKCCPDYQCECYHEDRVYANGERLKTSPDGGCKVCYCRGGEIQCTEVSCYVRSDCQGKFVPGQCCPKYDNCPLKEFSAKDIGASKPEEVEKNTNEENNTQIEVNSENSTDLQTESEVVSETQQTPSILKIGDKVLYLKKGDSEVSTPVIIIGAEGLQIGFEESEEYENNTQNSLFNNSNDLEPKVAESTHILSLVKHRKKPDEERKQVESTTVLEEMEDLEEATESSKVESSTSTEASPLTSTVLVLEETTPRIEESENTTNATEIDEEKEEMKMIVKTAFSVTGYGRSVESIEDTSEESDENTTPKYNYTSISSDISIETSETESHDMVQTESIETEIDKIIEEKSNNTSFIEEVEMIDVKPQNETSEKSSEKRKRESSIEDEADEVFRQLEVELNVDNTERTQSVEEENEEAEKIFQELINETSTTKSAKKKDANSESVERITNAIAGFAFGGRKGSSDGSNVLGMLSNLFNFQHRFGRKK